MSEQTVQVEVAGDGTAAALRGELDLLAYDQVSAELAPLFDAEGDVVVDVSGLSFVDSSGIRLFVRLQRALEERGRLHLTGATPHVASVFQVAGLPELGIAVDRADA